MEESNYWKRLAKKRLSRRRLLTGAAGVGAGLAALSVVGCGEEAEEAATPGATPAASPTGTPAVSPAATASPTPGAQPLEPAGSRGGILRWMGYDPLPLDTLDPHQTQLGPLYNMHSAVFSKVLTYEDVAEGIMGTDLAEAMPEIPDNLTYVVKLRPNVRFHDTEKIRKNFPGLAGRELTAEDVKYSIERQANKESPKSALFYRMSQWESVDKIEVSPDGLTMTITTKEPVAPFVHYLADTNSFIIGRELVDVDKDDMNSPDKMIGTGPFILDEFSALQMVRCLRNPDWFAKDDLADIGLPDRPILDGYEAVYRPDDDTTIQAAFRSKQIDSSEFAVESNVEPVTAELGAEYDEVPETGWINSRLLIDDSPAATSPLKDLRLRQAISIGVDRNRLGQQMYEGFFVLQSPVGQAVKKWALPMSELTKKPGYRFKADEREADLVEARRLWEAAGGPDIGPVEIVYSAIPESVKQVFPQLQRMLADNLDWEVTGHLDPTGYTEIAQGVLEKRLVFVFGYDNGWIDLDDWVYPYFHSRGSKNSFMLSDPTLDEMLEGQRGEFDEQRRQQLGYDIQHYLLDNVQARLEWISNVARWAEWPYRRNRRPQPWFGYVFNLANEWLDQEHATFEGRSFP
jgi:peptide/nickel transport system substrate-binding protein